MNRAAPVIAWVVLVLAGIAFVSRLHVSADMAAFLPRGATPAQQVLVEQMRDGVVARLVLIAVEGAPADRLADISKRLAAKLRTDAAFATVSNGELTGLDADRAFISKHRYVLSDQVEPDRFTEAGLHAALLRDLDALGSSTGFLVKQMLADDPTGEMLHILEGQMRADMPAQVDGVIMSPDHTRALLLAQLRTPGSDIEGAHAALEVIRQTFHEVAQEAGAPGARLVLSGPPVFAVDSRDRIRGDMTRLSAAATGLVITGLLLAYRSPRALLFAFVPVATGLLAGVVAVGLVFPAVQGITLGFGATLIGEAVDYAIYLFTQTTPDSPPRSTIRRIWPTMALGTLTSVCGFSAMLLSSFEGFAQLGVLTIAGLATAACVTRWVLPALLPRSFAGVRQSRSLMRIAALAERTRPLRLPAAVLVAAAILSLALSSGQFWAGDLASLSPVPADQLRLDQSLRRDLHAPEAGFMVTTQPEPTVDAALSAAEQAAAKLRGAMRDGAIGGFEDPTQFWPSLATQRARQAALPDPATLRAALAAAQRDTPFQPDLFQPFLLAVQQARESGPITRADFAGTALALKLDSLLLHGSQGWIAMLPLRAVKTPDAVRATLGGTGASLVDFRAESNIVLQTYLREGTTLAGLGAAAICVLLLAALRSWRRLVRVVLPLAAAVVVTLASLRLGGHALSVFNLFGLLLVVAIGSNYCLFFDRQPADPAARRRMLASLLLANASTVAGFGVLAFSQTPVLHDLGFPVALGTLLSLLFASIVFAPAGRRAAP